MHSTVTSSQFLAPEDLALLQTFLEAWCAENSVDIKDKAARDVAVGLIHWYQDGHSDKSGLKAHITDAGSLPPALQRLVETLSYSECEPQLNGRCAHPMALDGHAFLSRGMRIYR